MAKEIIGMTHKLFKHAGIQSPLWLTTEIVLLTRNFSTYLVQEMGPTCLVIAVQAIPVSLKLLQTVFPHLIDPNCNESV